MHPGLEVSDTDNLLALGVMDSLSFVELVEEVQERYAHQRAGRRDHRGELRLHRRPGRLHRGQEGASHERPDPLRRPARQRGAQRRSHGRGLWGSAAHVRRARPCGRRVRGRPAAARRAARGSRRRRARQRRGDGDRDLRRPARRRGVHAAERDRQGGEARLPARALRLEGRGLRRAQRAPRRERGDPRAGAAARRRASAARIGDTPSLEELVETRPIRSDAYPDDDGRRPGVDHLHVRVDRACRRASPSCTATWRSSRTRSSSTSACAATTASCACCRSRTRTGSTT